MEWLGADGAVCPNCRQLVLDLPGQPRCLFCGAFLQEFADPAEINNNLARLQLPRISGALRRKAQVDLVKVRPFRPRVDASATVQEPPAIHTVDALRTAFNEAKTTDDYTRIFGFYVNAFNSFQDLNEAFWRRGTRKDSSDRFSTTASDLDLDFVAEAYKMLMQLPTDLQKATLKSVINCLLSDQRNADVVLMRPICRDNLRAYTILLQNPQFLKPSTYVIFAHLLRQLATLCDVDHQLLAEWFATLSKDQFQTTIRIVKQFISMRLFPPKPEDLPPLSKCSWWIPCAVKNLAVLNAANGSNIVSLSEFYIDALDHWDIMADFIQWQTPTMNSGFSFCQYPFLLSMNAKKTILEGHAEQQMIATARDSIIGNLAVRRTPDMDMLFLTITVRRQHLLEDSLRELSQKQGQLRKKLRVQFEGEPGLDMGGLTKEWFQLLVRRIFHADYGMFVYHSSSETYWFTTTDTTDINEMLQEYHLIGVLMGLAVYNGVILDIRFPLCCYKKLLSPPVVPRVLDVFSTPLGVASVDLEDLTQIVPQTARGLAELLNYEDDVEADFGIAFEIGVEEFGVVQTIELKENGNLLPVTNDNRDEYVNRYVDWFLNEAVSRQFKAFYLGFHSVCSTNLLLLLQPEEIELLVCGSVTFDMHELRNVTSYDGFAPSDKTIRYFWDLVLKLPEKHQKRLLLFVTGSDRVPVGGLKEMKFKITKMISTNSALSPEQMLPMAHTCFNQLILPDYRNRDLLRQKLAIALAHGEGFGLE